MKRSQAEEQIKLLGAQAKPSVVKDLSYLVTNDPLSGSAKNKKARELGIPIIDEEQFLALLAKPDQVQVQVKARPAKKRASPASKEKAKKAAPADEQGELFQNGSAC